MSEQVPIVYLVRADHEIGGEVAVRRGEFVVKFNGHDFGVANADHRCTRLRHINVLKRSGDTELFFIPFSKLKRQKLTSV